MTTTPDAASLIKTITTLTGSAPSQQAQRACRDVINERDNLESISKTLRALLSILDYAASEPMTVAASAQHTQATAALEALINNIDSAIGCLSISATKATADLLARRFQKLAEGPQG